MLGHTGIKDGILIDKNGVRYYIMVVSSHMMYSYLIRSSDGGTPVWKGQDSWDWKHYSRYVSDGAVCYCSLTINPDDLTHGNVDRLAYDSIILESIYHSLLKDD